MVFLFLMFFFVFFKCRVLFFFETKNVQNYKYDAFLMGKDSISWQSECFVAVLLTLFNSY